MKKLLAVILVLGMASMASAALSLQATNPGPLVPSDTTTIQLVNDVDSLGSVNFAAIILIDGQAPGEWTGEATINRDNVINGAPGLEGGGYLGPFDITGDSVPDFDLWQIDTGFPSTVQNLAGVWAEFGFHCTGEGPVEIQLLSDGLAVLDSIIIEQVPEPMTMSLLGLGGLALLRRRR